MNKPFWYLGTRRREDGAWLVEVNEGEVLATFPACGIDLINGGHMSAADAARDHMERLAHAQQIRRY